VASPFLPITSEAIMAHIRSTLSFLRFTDFPWSLYSQHCIVAKLSFLIDSQTLLSKTAELVLSRVKPLSYFLTTWMDVHHCQMCEGCLQLSKRKHYEDLSRLYTL
jgi:hypothetical protein